MARDVTRQFGSAHGEQLQALLFSIAPVHADRIFGLTKLWEFRRICPRAAQGTIALVYETSPRMAVTGTFTIGKIHTDDPARLAALEKDLTSSFDVYYYLEGASRPAAIQIINPRRFPQALPITVLGIKRPPQSYAWVVQPIQAP